VQIDGEVTPMTPEQEALFEKYTKELKLNSEVANTLARDAALSKFYEEALSAGAQAINLANIVANEVARELKENALGSLKFTPQDIAELAKMLDEEKISSKIAKQVFEEMVQSGAKPAKIVADKGLIQISNPAEIAPIVDEVIANNPENVEKFKAGNKKLLGFFVGQVLKATGGKANPKIVNQLVAQKLQ